MQRHPRVLTPVAVLLAVLSCVPAIAHAADDYTPFEGEKTTWHDGSTASTS